MDTAFIRFYEELNDFLPLWKRKIPYPVHFREKPAVKSIIESEGVPHAEVDLVLVNGKAVSLSEKIGPGDLISVYPEFESFDISSVKPSTIKPLRESKFLLDTHLGKLCRYMRMMGFDSWYDNRLTGAEIIRIAILEKRTILTRDRHLLMRKTVQRGYWIRGEMVYDQAWDVIRRFDLEKSLKLFSICTRCNGKLQPVEKGTVLELYPGYEFYPGTFFYRCEGCFHIYWNGSHCNRFEQTMGLAAGNNDGSGGL